MTEKMRVSASSVISSAAATAATATRAREIGNGTVYFTRSGRENVHEVEVHYAVVRASEPRAQGGPRSDKLKPTPQPEPGRLVLLCLAAWAIPGAGHLWLGRRAKGLMFLAAVPLMFAIGLAIQGRLFPFDFSDPLVGLAAIANLGNGVPYLVASMLDLGSGQVRAVTYEYGNAYLIVAGLLNMLVVVDAYDVALGRK